MTLYLLVVLFTIVTSVFKVSSQCDHGEVRLVGGSGPHEGRVEVCIVSQWSRVCSYSWDAYDATVVCRQLGYSPHGAATSRTEFGQGDGSMWLNNVHCDPNINKALLECYSTLSTRTSSITPCDDDAGVKCTDEPRVRNVTALTLSTSSTGSVHTVLVTWEQNLTVDEPSSFKVECLNEHHSIGIRVSNKTFNTQFGGLFSSLYNCCVSAVYPLYEARQICTGINTTSNVIIVNSTDHPCVTTMQSNSTTIIAGGVLGITIIILISLISLSVVCLIRQHTRKRVISESIPTQQNVSYSLVAVRESQLTTSETPTQVMRSASEDESATNHKYYDVI